MAELERILFQDLAHIIEQGKQQATSQVNSVLTITYWQIGKKINDHILQNNRAAYGKEIVLQISVLLSNNYGKSFQEKNLRRMMQFAEVYPSFEILAPVARQLTWTHFTILIPIRNEEARTFYAQKTIEERWSKRELTRQIGRKVFERNEIVKPQTIETASAIQNSFKDPYFLDFLGLKDGYLENDIESAIIKELELFILELGKGFAFIERQKRMIIDGKDFYLDLLFYHRKLNRLIAIELKLGEFKPAFKGQMELYLKWLDKYEKQENESHPIGLILCAGKSNEQIELLEMHKDGILVAEYWTELPPKKQLEEKLHQALIAARARIESQKTLED